MQPGKNQIIPLQ